MTIRLPKDLEHFIQEKVASGQFASEEDAISEAVRLLRLQDEQTASARARVESLLIEGLDSGPSTPMTSGDWDEVEREGQRIIAARKARKSRLAL